MAGVEFALRVWLDPAKMAAFDLTSSDVMTVLNSNNYQSATGQATGYFTLFNGNAGPRSATSKSSSVWWSPPATAAGSVSPTSRPRSPWRKATTSIAPASTNPGF